jgi:hypothetical protein
MLQPLSTRRASYGARFVQAASFVLAAAAATLVASPAEGATTCKNVSCATSCSPSPPVAISTLIDAGDFPVGGTTPIAFVNPLDGRPRRLVATQEGMILVWDGTTGNLLPTPFLDLRDDVGGPVLFGGERGLLSMAADPDYATTGRLFVYYTRSDGDLVVARYTRSAGNPDVGDLASATQILRIEHSSASNHNGGALAFGPDGFLYLSTGDGGGSCDGGLGANGDGQVNTTLLGKILRMDVRGIDPGAGPADDCGVGAGNYTVPSTNPFFGQEPACDEVYVMGLRNPFRFTFDRATGDIYIGDVGQNKWEEINIKRAATPAPVNFGWCCREGCETAGNDESACSVAGCLPDGGTTCQFPRATGGFYDPVLCHHNGSWVSIMGGYRYRGTRVPSLAGAYFYADAGCGQIWKTTTLDPANPAAIDSACWASGFAGDYGFAEDRYGELYVIVGGAGRIDCIHNGEGCYWAGWAFFSDGFESGSAGHWSGVQSP